MIARGFRQQMLLKKGRQESEESLIDLARPKKRVRVSMAEPTIHRYEIPEGKPLPSNGKSKRRPLSLKERTWLSTRDLAHFRSCAKKLCRSVSVDGILQDVYDDACAARDEGDCQAPSSTTEALALSEQYYEQRGLERWSSSQHAVFRSTKIVEVKTAVLLEQSHQFLSGKSDPAKLAEVSVKASCTSQRFALLLASVDATTANKVRHECPRAA